MNACVDTTRTAAAPQKAELSPVELARAWKHMKKCFCAYSIMGYDLKVAAERRWDKLRYMIGGVPDPNATQTPEVILLPCRVVALIHGGCVVGYGTDKEDARAKASGWGHFSDKGYFLDMELTGIYPRTMLNEPGRTQIWTTPELREQQTFDAIAMLECDLCGKSSPTAGITLRRIPPYGHKLNVCDKCARRA